MLVYTKMVDIIICNNNYLFINYFSANLRTADRLSVKEKHCTVLKGAKGGPFLSSRDSNQKSAS